MERIQSKDNELIKEIRKLKERKFRTAKKMFLIEGFRFVEEALHSVFAVPYIFICENQQQKFKEYIESGIGNTTKVYWVSESVIKSLSSTETPQGIVAVVENQKIDIQNQNGFYLFADKVQDPGNMGTLIRTAHAAGALGVILAKGCVDIYNEKTLRSTMGSIFKVPILLDEGYETILSLKEKGFKVIISSLAAEKSFYQANLTEKVIIVVGNEGAGISAEVEKLGDILVKIPMPGEAESLNVAIAAAIMMFEAVRQRNEINC